jgi:hypothetical protein
MPATIDRRDAEGIGQAVERKRARQTDDVATVDDAAAEAPGLFGLLVEMHAAVFWYRRVAIMCSLSSMVMPSTWSMRSPTW